MNSYKPICFTKVLGVRGKDAIPPKESVSNALEENPRNGSLTVPPAHNAPGGPLGLAMMTRTFWRPGRELKVAFKGGSQWQRVSYQFPQLYTGFTKHITGSSQERCP